MTTDEKIRLIMIEFDRWLATEVLNNNIPHDELPKLNDAFRDYFKSMRTAR